MQLSILALVAAAGGAVVFTRKPGEQAVGISFFGFVLALMFLIFQAPDVALSQIVVGAVALPLMVLLAIARIRVEELRRLERARRSADGDEGGDDNGRGSDGPHADGGPPRPGGPEATP